MYQAPEVTHLVRAVNAVKRAIATDKKREPEDDTESDIDSEHEDEEKTER